MLKEYARFKKPVTDIGWIYESIREDGKVFWKLLYKDYTFFCKHWKMSTDVDLWGCRPDFICKLLLEEGWQQIKGSQSVTQASLTKNPRKEYYDREKDSPQGI